MNLSSDNRGNAMVEFALSFAILVPVFLGTFEFGYAFYIYNQMQTATRGGARYASLCSYDSYNSTPSEAFLAAVQNMVVYGNPDGGEAPVVPGLAPEDVTLTVTFNSGVPEQVTVGIGDFQVDAVVQMLDFTAKPQVTMPYLGRFDPL
jgi:Flp pilus assembly protein TadG